MKKFMVVLGMLFVLIVGAFAIANKPVDVDTINAARYEQVCEKIENRFGEDAVYKIEPQVTRNGIVDVYRVDVITVDGIDIDVTPMRCSFN